MNKREYCESRESRAAFPPLQNLLPRERERQRIF